MQAIIKSHELQPTKISPKSWLLISFSLINKLRSYFQNLILPCGLEKIYVKCTQLLMRTRKVELTF